MPGPSRTSYDDGVSASPFSVPWSALRALLDRPAEPDAPGPLRLDWLLVAVVVLGTLLEVVVVPERSWRVVSLVAMPILALALPWRRRHPLPTVTAVFAGTVAIRLASIAADAEWVGPVAGAVFLVFPYSLFRWASGRHAVAGLVVIWASALGDLAATDAPLGDVVGGLSILLAVAVTGAWMRTLRDGRRQELDRARLLEREQLARELHDTVAHHVSAIAIQAQAGRAVAATRPEAAAETLGIIEAEAKRTLGEMRSIVGALRHDAALERTTIGGVADLERLVEGRTIGVEVERRGELDRLVPSVDAAVFRLAQESITNAVRHARNARTVSLTVIAEGERLRFRALDDGDPVASVGADGFGLVGMRERAELLGGSLSAGPGPQGGWLVEAELPLGPSEEIGGRP